MDFTAHPTVTPQHRVLKSIIDKLNRMNNANEALNGLFRNAKSLDDINVEGLSQISFMINSGHYDIFEELQRLDRLEDDFERIKWLEKEIPRKKELYNAYAGVTDSEVQKIAEMSIKTLARYKSELETLQKSVADFSV